MEEKNKEFTLAQEHAAPPPECAALPPEVLPPDTVLPGEASAAESADMVLMKPNLMDVVKALKISQATITTIKENLFWAFIYNILSIPVAMGVLHIFGGPLLDPMIAGLAMSFSSVSVVLNALRLKRRKV